MASCITFQDILVSFKLSQQYLKMFEESGYYGLDLLKDATLEELTQDHVLKFKKGLQKILGQHQQTFAVSKGTTETKSSDILCSHKPSGRGDVLNHPMLNKKESLIKEKSE